MPIDYSRYRRREFLKLSGLAGVGAVVGACVGGTSQPPAASGAEAPKGAGAPKKGGTLTILVAESILGVNLFRDGGFVARGVWHQIYNSLLDADMDQQIVPALAAAPPERNAAQTEFTFKLRQGVTFHDGTPFDADAVMWQYGEILKDPKGWLGGLTSPYMKGVEKVDQYTVKVITHGPAYDFLPFMSFSHVFAFQSRALYQKLGPKDYGFTGAAGTGPFKVESFTSGQDLVLVRNDNYWGKGSGGLPYLDRIVVRTVADASSRQIQLQTGAADVLYATPASIVGALKAAKGVSFVSMPGGTQHFLRLFPWTGSPFADKRVRQAIYYGIDRKEIVDRVLLGQAAVATSIFPPGMFAADTTERYPYDPQKAAQLLAAAGYSSSRPLVFTTHTSTVFPWPDESVLIQAQLAKVGVQMKIQQLEQAAINRSVNLGPEAISERQAILFRRGLDGFIFNDYTYRPFHSKGGVNTYGYNQPGGIQNPEAEALLTRQVQMTDTNELRTAGRKINELVLEDAPIVFIAYENNNIAIRDHVKGFKPWPASQPPLHTVWIDK